MVIDPPALAPNMSGLVAGTSTLRMSESNSNDNSCHDVWNRIRSSRSTEIIYSGRRSVRILLVMLLSIGCIFNNAANISHYNVKSQNLWEGISLAVSKHAVERLCNETNKIVNVVRDHALLNETEALLWHQRGPFKLLTCDELIRSLPILKNSSSSDDYLSGRNNNITGVLSEYVTASDDDNDSKFELQNLISLQRLAKKLIKLEHHNQQLTIVVIGGSMTTGWVDGSEFNNNTYNLAFPRKLEQFMKQQWPASSLRVMNLAVGGADEVAWLGKLHLVMEVEPDIILVESAVNDQCDYHNQDERAQFVHQKSFSLLNLLMDFPKKPAVISVELFRTSYGEPLGSRDAVRHCRGHVFKTSDPLCYLCPQWWKPQTWRENARNLNSVSHASYRDAVWPVQNHPPDDLCSKYWSGLSHPEAGVHAMVASTIFFQFLVVIEKKHVLLKLSKQSLVSAPKAIETPKNICLDHISSYHAKQDDPRDPFQDDIISDGNRTNSKNRYGGSCWSFRADVKRKYGWICEVSRKNLTASSGVTDHGYLRLTKKLRIGGDQKIIMSRLVSYDERMAIAQVWFTASSNIGVDSATNDSNENIFQGDPVWNISSWHQDKKSIPQPYAIQLGELQFKDSSQIQWPMTFQGGDVTNIGSSSNNSSSNFGSKSVEVTFNLKILLGSSRSISESQVDKFKLLGVVTC